MHIFFTVITILFLIGGYLIVTQTIQGKGNFGVNLKAFSKPLKCTNCNETLSIVRAPQNLREILWGGWTCTKCGKKFDKWGKEL